MPCMPKSRRLRIAAAAIDVNRGLCPNCRGAYAHAVFAKFYVHNFFMRARERAAIESNSGLQMGKRSVAKAQAVFARLCSKVKHVG